MISRPLIKTCVAPKVVRMFHKTVAQAGLPCASETWVVTPRMLEALDSFNHHIACRITGEMPRLIKREWKCPPLAKAMEEAGLCSIGTCIRNRQNTVAECITTCPICELCQEAPSTEHSHI